MTMGDRIAILNDGELQQTGRPKEVYEDPVNDFVGGFVGSPSMNFLDLDADDDGEHAHLRNDDGFAYELTGSVAESVRRSDADRVRFGVRPEDVAVGRGSLEATVEVVEPVGSDNYLYLDVAPEFVARVDSDLTPAAGDVVALDFDQADVRLFDAETGESLTRNDQKAQFA